MPITTPSNGPLARLSPAAAVLVDVSGPALVRLDPARSWGEQSPTSHRLDRDDLWFLAEYSRSGDPETANEQGFVAAERVEELLGVLTEFGMLADDDVDSGESSPLPAVPECDPTRPITGIWSLRLPQVLSLRPGRLVGVDHAAQASIDLDPDELIAATCFRQPIDVDDAFAAQRALLDGGGLSRVRFDRLVGRLIEHALLGSADDPSSRIEPAAVAAYRSAIRAEASLARSAEERHARHDEVRASGSSPRGVRIIPVQVAGVVPPLSTGMVFAHLRAELTEEFSDIYDLHPRWITKVDQIPDGGAQDIYLFTNYLWSHERNLEFSAEVKRRNPAAITIHGGPDCPSYPVDAEAYLREHPHVDIAVRGEGEATATEVLAALAPSLRAGPADLVALAHVAGLTLRAGGEVIRTPDRPRITDLDAIPSPYLTGVFDAFGDTRSMSLAVIETNRGCPYGCTFCDWGSATNSRIRKFDLDRILDEFTWCAMHEVPRIFIADANFGIFERDVDIARHVVALREQYGYPQRLITNYAKNTVKHLAEIVSVLVTGGVLTEGLMSLQSMDEATLAAIRRSNIKLEKYEALSREFRQRGLPLFVDLMMGLPGQTVRSLADDFQQCVDREVNAKCHATELLVNSPMNAPEYRSEHRIEVSRKPGATGLGSKKAASVGASLVISSSSFTRDEYHEMHCMRRSYLLAENLGVLRQLTRFVRHEYGIAEVALIERLRDAATRGPAQWPFLALGLLAVPDAMAPPVSWGLFVAELRRFLIADLGVSDRSDLDTVLAVQHALLPAAGRSFPLVLELEHDYVAWHAAVLDAKDAGHVHDWEPHVEPLASFPPATMSVDDPRHLCRNLGVGSALDAYLDWELDSPVARAMPGHYQIG